MCIGNAMGTGGYREATQVTKQALTKTADNIVCRPHISSGLIVEKSKDSNLLSLI